MKSYVMRITGILLSLALLLTMLGGLIVSADVKSGKYYVAPNGTGNGKTIDTAARSIGDVMQTIIDDSYSKGDEVTIYVSGGEGATTVQSGSLAVNYAWTWPKSESETTTPAHIIITSMPDAEAPAVLSSGSDAPHIAMADTTYKNIILYDEANEVGMLFTNGHNVTIDEDVYFKKGSDLNDWKANIFVGCFYSHGLKNDAEGTLTVNNSENNKNYSLNFGGYTWNGASDDEANYLNGDKTVIVNGGTVERLNLVGFKRNAEYNSNINVVLNGAKLNEAAVSSESGYAPAINGSIQIVANGTSLPDTDSIISYAKDKNIPYYIINSTSASNSQTDLLTVTDTPGTYSVKSGEKAIAVDMLDSGKVFTSQDEKLTVPSGKYLVTRKGTGGDEGVYYVQYGGTGDGLSPDSPLATVDDAVKAANTAGFATGDTVYINVMQSADWSWGAQTIGAGGDYRADAHKITTWAERGAITSHKFTAVVQGEEDGNIYLASSGRLGLNLDMVLGGPTVFKDIVLVRMRRWRGLYADGYDVTYGKGTKFACVNVDDCDAAFTVWDGIIYDSDQNTTVSLGNVNALSGGGGGTVEFDSEALVFTATVSSIADVWTTGVATGPTAEVEKYINDVALVYNNSNIVSEICWGNSYGGGTLFEKNLNFNIVSASKIEYTQGKGGVTVNGGLQIISSAEIDGLTAVPDNVTVNAGKWFIKNYGICDLIDFTDTAGTFSVKNGCRVIAINTSTNEKTVSSGGVLTVSPGEYTVTEFDTDDGITNATDLVMLKKYLLGIEESVGSFADYNGDKDINLLDLVALKKHIQGVQLVVGGYLMTTETLSGGADAEAETLKAAIMTKTDTIEASGNTYYVSSGTGKDIYTGKYKAFPIATISRVNELDLKSGDRVLFKRGDIFRTDEQLELVTGVSYGAYGEGDKPKIYGSLKNYASSDLWQSDNNMLWKTSLSADEAGNMVFNDGEAVGVLKKTLAQVSSNGDYYFDKENSMLYLYLRENNPGKYFSSIEISSTENLLYAKYGVKNVTVENLTLKYAAEFGISMYIIGGGFNITGCEIGWIGGGYTGDETETRYGNAIEFWCRAENCNVTDNYIYQVYDAAITFQGSANNTYKNLNISNNLIEYCSMNFEFWAKESTKDGVTDSVEISDIDFKNNILRFSGYGFGGKQRANRSGQAFVLAWNYEYNAEQISNFNITENIFDCANSYFFYGEKAFGNVSIKTNKYYQMPGSEYFVVKGVYSKSDNQEEFERAISSVDSSATLIKFINK